jgi:tRNA(adenine34) deaminase
MLKEYWMRLALQEAKDAAAKGAWPCGAVIVREDQLIAKGQNEVRLLMDATAHAEVQAIRVGCQQLQSSKLTNTELYTTAEPCPMCISACVWASISRVYYGVSIGDLIGLGEEQIAISAQDILEKAFCEIHLVSGLLREECLELYKTLHNVS